MTLAEDIASSVLVLKFETLPDDVVSKAKLLVLDHAGCMIAGGNTHHAQMLTTFLSQHDIGGVAPSFLFLGSIL